MNDEIKSAMAAFMADGSSAGTRVIITGGYTVKQVENDFHIPRSTQYYWQKLKLMPKPIRLGVKKVIYPREVFDQWLRDRAAQSAQAA